MACPRPAPCKLAALLRADGLAELAEGPVRELGLELRAALDHVERVGGLAALRGARVFLDHIAKRGVGERGILVLVHGDLFTLSLVPASEAGYDLRYRNRGGWSSSVTLLVRWSYQSPRAPVAMQARQLVKKQRVRANGVQKYYVS